jgi:hypothetical protein
MKSKRLKKVLFLVCLHAVCGRLGVALADLPEPLAYYPLDGSGNEFTDQNVDLSPIGEPTYAASMSAGLGQAISLDGLNDGLVGSGFVYSTTGAITLSAWVKLETAVTTLPGSIFKNWNGQFHFGVEWFGGQLTNFVNVTPWAGQPSVAAPSSFPVGVWKHVAVVVNSATHEQRLFIDGSLVATATFPGTLTTTPCAGLGIGVKTNCQGTDADHGNVPGFWDGQLDEIAAWDQALTDGQIAEIYALGLAGSPIVGNPPPAPDADADGVPDASDNCVAVANPDQTDTDLDGQGDACDLDNDNDGIADTADNCKFTPNPDQADLDGDGFGNVCDTDPDGDGVTGAADNCPLVPNSDQTNTDGDSAGDDCDVDDDNDSVCDIGTTSPGCTAGPDNCPTIFNTDQQDLEGDGIGDACDADLDGDSVNNGSDNCPVDPNVDQNDADGDGAGDVCDADIDNDTVANAADNCPSLANTDQSDLDADGQGDACDGDVDGDGIATTADNCPLVANSDQFDFDGDGSGDACDGDIDGDGVANGGDSCGLTPNGEVTDPQSGCSIAQLCPCAGPAGTTTPWKNHGKYVSCVAHVAGDFAGTGVITQAQKDATVSTAGESNCGR